MWHRILAILIARNREFYRDRAGFSWNILMPFMMVFAFAFIFSEKPADLLKIGVLGTAQGAETSVSNFLGTAHMSFIPQQDESSAVTKVDHHQIDLLLDLRDPPRYWVNIHSAKGYLAERLLIASDGNPESLPERLTVTGQALRYVDWVLPGILAMNVMFSSLWGVGWVTVRYRKNGVLRRLKATPLSAMEFLTAQILSRLMVVMSASVVVYVGADLFLDFMMRGSFVALILIYLAGALCLISLGLLVAARLHTEELADGILNLISWPMLLLSGVWFSMEGTSQAAQALSRIFPLTHLVNAARRVMVDGGGVADVLPEVAILGGTALILLVVSAWLFRWE